MVAHRGGKRNPRKSMDKRIVVLAIPTQGSSPGEVYIYPVQSKARSW